MRLRRRRTGYKSGDAGSLFDETPFLEEHPKPKRLGWKKEEPKIMKKLVDIHVQEWYYIKCANEHRT